MIAFIWFLPQIKLCHMGLQILNKLRWFSLFFNFFFRGEDGFSEALRVVQRAETCRPMIASKVSQHSL